MAAASSIFQAAAAWFFCIVFRAAATAPTCSCIAAAGAATI